MNLLRLVTVGGTCLALVGCGILTGNTPNGMDANGLCRSNLVTDFNLVNDAQDRYDLLTLLGAPAGERCNELDQIDTSADAFLENYPKISSCRATNNREILNLGLGQVKAIKEDHAAGKNLLCLGVTRPTDRLKVEPETEPANLSPCELELWNDKEALRVSLLTLLLPVAENDRPAEEGAPVDPNAPIDPAVLAAAEEEAKQPKRIFKNQFYCQDTVLAERAARAIDTKWGKDLVCDRNATNGGEPLGDRFEQIADLLQERAELMRCNRCAKDTEDETIPARGCFGYVYDPTISK